MSIWEKWAYLESNLIPCLLLNLHNVCMYKFSIPNITSNNLQIQNMTNNTVEQN